MNRTRTLQPDGRGTIALPLLIAATVVVGLSIAADGSLARALNGIAGLMWFAATAMYLARGWAMERRPMIWLATFALTAMVAFVIRPSDLLLASIGFFLAGGVSALLHQGDEIFWSTMIPAVYLPMHIGTAILKSVVSALLDHDAPIRTDPPPTAVIVPFVMVLAAYAAGALVKAMRNRDRS